MRGFLHKKEAMKTTLTKVVLLSLVAIDIATANSEHLTPVSLSPDYYQKLIHTFRDGYGSQPSLQALVIPSLANEYLAGIRATPTGSEAFLVEPKYSVRMFQTAESAKAGNERAKRYIFPPDIPDSFLKNPIQIHTRSIPRHLSRTLCKIWISELYMIKSATQDSRILLDPTTFIFSENISKGELIKGQTVDPMRGSSISSLADLAYTLNGYVLGDINEVELEARATAIEVRFPEKNRVPPRSCEKL